MTEMKKDPMYLAKSVKRGVDSKKRDLLQVSLNKDMALSLVEGLVAAIEEGKDRGVKFSFHISQKETDAGRSFDSCFFFVKAIQEFGTFNKKPSGQSEDMRAKIEKIKKELSPA